MISFVVPLRVTGDWGLNKIYAGVHWSVRKRQAEEVHLLVRAALLNGKIPRRIFERPAEVTLAFHSRMDIDNHGYLAKLIIDGMKGWLLQDDSRKFVRKVTLTFWEGEGVRVEIGEVSKI